MRLFKLPLLHPSLLVVLFFICFACLIGLSASITSDYFVGSLTFCDATGKTCGSTFERSAHPVYEVTMCVCAVKHVLTCFQGPRLYPEGQR